MDAGVQVQLLVEILNHYVLFYEVMLIFINTISLRLLFSRLGTQI